MVLEGGRISDPGRFLLRGGEDPAAPKRAFRRAEFPPWRFGEEKAEDGFGRLLGSGFRVGGVSESVI